MKWNGNTVEAVLAELRYDYSIEVLNLSGTFVMQ